MENGRRAEMEKLMDTDPYNRAIPKKLIGEDMFGDTYPTCSTTCQKQTDCDDCPIQEAFARLRQYEQTGLTPEEVLELKERDTAKSPAEADEDFGYFKCPSCGTNIIADDFNDHKFCLNCGQRLKF